MQEQKTPILDRVPPPAEVRQRLDVITREAISLRKLLRLAKQVHSPAKAPPMEVADGR